MKLLVSLNKALLNPYFSGGYVRGGYVDQPELWGLVYMPSLILTNCVQNDAIFESEDAFYKAAFLEYAY